MFNDSALQAKQKLHTKKKKRKNKLSNTLSCSHFSDNHAPNKTDKISFLANKIAHSGEENLININYNSALSIIS